MIDQDYKESLHNKKQSVLEIVNKASQIIYDLVLEDVEKEDANETSFPCKLELIWDDFFGENGYDVVISVCGYTIWNLYNDGRDSLSLLKIRLGRNKIIEDEDFINERKEFLESGV